MGINSFPDQVLWHGISKISSLQRSRPKRPKRHSIRLPERRATVRQIVLLAEFLHKRGNLPELGSRQSRKQVVLDLKLQSAVKPIHPRRTLDVESPGGLLLEPVVPTRRTDIDARREMIQTELNVLDSGDGEARDDEHYPLTPVREARDEERIPNPEREETQNLLTPVGHLVLRQQQCEGLGEQVDAGEAHDGVERPVLVANEEPGDGVEVHLPVVVARGEGGEELGGHHEEGHVLEIRIEVEAVAGNVVGVVVALPPGDADAGEAVAGEDLREPVLRRPGHDPVVARVVPHPPALNPEEAHHRAAEEVHPRALRRQHAQHAGAEQRRDEAHGGERNVALPVEQAHAGELAGEAAVVPGHLGHGVALEAAAGVEAAEAAPGGAAGRVEGDEGVGGVLAGEAAEREVAARVVLDPLGDVVDLALDGDPEVAGLVVARQLFGRDGAAIGVRHSNAVAPASLSLSLYLYRSRSLGRSVAELAAECRAAKSRWRTRGRMEEEIRSTR